MNHFQEFIFPSSKWINKEKELKENKAKSKRHSEKLEILGKLLEEKLTFSFENLEEENYTEELKSFNGKSLEKKDILKTKSIGEEEFMRFVDERLIRRVTGIKDRIKKKNVQTFPSITSEPKKSQKKTIHEKSELKLVNKVINIIQDRPLIHLNTLHHHQFSDKTALTSSSDQIEAYMRGGKSKIITDFFAKTVPDAFKAERPQVTDLIIIEAENVIATAPVKKKTVREHSEYLVDHKIKPYLASCDSLVVMFDDIIQPMRIKNTDDLRYSNEKEVVCMNFDFMLEDWDLIFKNRANKQEFKKFFTLSALQYCGNILKPGQKIFFNGVFSDGEVKVVTKKDWDYDSIESRSDLQLTQGESDTKIFEIIEKLSAKKPLIVSLDTDVKMLAIYHCAKDLDLDIIVRSGTGLFPSYFHARNVVEFIQSDFKVESNEDLLNQSKAMLRTYALLGCDYNPSFYGVTHNLGMRTLQEMSQKRILKSQDDFLQLIVKVYQHKNQTLKRMFPDPSSKISTDEQILVTRSILKAAKGSEQETLPIPSTIRLHLKRSEFVLKLWTGEIQDTDDPVNFGYIR